jgi:hypothetical protein
MPYILGAFGPSFGPNFSGIFGGRGVVATGGLEVIALAVCDSLGVPQVPLVGPSSRRGVLYLQRLYMAGMLFRGFHRGHGLVDG